MGRKPGQRPNCGFKPGQSGNPGGRPKHVTHVRELARKYTEEAIEALVDVCRSSKSDSARVAAATSLLDRGYGKPLQPVEQEVSKLPDDELKKRVRRLVSADQAQKRTAPQHEHPAPRTTN